MNDQIKREEALHGKNWNAVHGGYFSDADVAAPLLMKMKELAARARADVIVDLGGGTGFLLSQFLSMGQTSGAALVNLDTSTNQLEAARERGIRCVHGSVDSFLRKELGPEENKFAFMMRSVLHYFGQDGLCLALRHLRAQARKGEYFVHQTASFKNEGDAKCMNELYRMMRTPKWYPEMDFFKSCLRQEGWRVLEVLPALPLRLTSEDLMERYQLSQTDIESIKETLSASGPVPKDVIKMTEEGFCAFLHYWIYVCEAA